MRMMHLNKGGVGMAARTACGRNILRTPLSTDWEGFKEEQSEHQCKLCAASKQAKLNARSDAKELAKWEPEDSEAWKTRDDAMVAAHRAT